jgi:hypothetical protein
MNAGPTARVVRGREECDLLLEAGEVIVSARLLLSRCLCV